MLAKSQNAHKLLHNVDSKYKYDNFAVRFFFSLDLSLSLLLSSPLSLTLAVNASQFKLKLWAMSYTMSIQYVTCVYMK